MSRPNSPRKPGFSLQETPARTTVWTRHSPLRPPCTTSGWPQYSPRTATTLTSRFSDCSRRDVKIWWRKGHFASYAGVAPIEASSGEVVRHRLSLAGNRKLNYARPGRTLEAQPTTARSSRRANPARRLCGASRGASAMPFSGASWRIRWRPLAAPLDNEEPRIPKRRSSQNSSSETVRKGARATL
jgi:Transposase IS116/IS110/IS902 family